MRRAPTGKPISLTSRDIEIFRWLARYRYLRSTYLHAAAGGASETRLKERLGGLFHEGYIDRPQMQWERADARYQPAVYEIGTRAERILAEHGVTDAAARTFLRPAVHRQFAHSVMICECLASIELAANACEHLRFVSWPEVLAKAPDRTKALPVPYCMPIPGGAVVPDGLFGLEYRHEDRKAYRFFALEIDRGTMPLTRYDARKTSLLGKLAAYREIVDGALYKSHLGVPNLLILTVTTSTARSEEALVRFAEQGEQPQFLFKAPEPCALLAPDPRLLLEPWSRAGLAPLSIGR